MLLKNGKPFVWYDISDDRGTNTYRFDCGFRRFSDTRSD
jgi:hypothetical protein